MRLKPFALALGLVATIATGAVASEPRDNPVKTMRELQALQDRIATGDTIAQAAHAKAVGRIARAFAGLRPDTWTDARNARALAAYVFSGGNAFAMRQAIPPSLVAKDVAALYEGALAYGSGDDARARVLLQSIEAKTLPPGLAGHVALVQATLSETADKTKAVALLDLARLLEPGTLVEEAALRKEIPLIGADGDLDKLVLLTRRYENAFSRSVYAANYRQLFVGLAIKVAAADTPTGNARTERLVETLGKDERRKLYLAIARQETMAGHLVSAPFAALAARRLAGRGDRDEARALVYFGASAIVGDQYDLALASLEGASSDRLDAKDQALRASALDVASTMHAVAHRAPGDDAPRDDRLVADGERALAATQGLGQ